jgi:hypothetical protein
MFLSPPMLRRRKPLAAAAASHIPPSTSAADDSTTSDIDMGNEQSFAHLPDNTKAAAFNFVATHPNGAGLMSMLTSSTPPTQQQQVDSGKKFQCRWCIETFPRKFNKDRHEARKHARKLAEAASADSEEASELQPSSTLEFSPVRETGRKRNLSEALQVELSTVTEIMDAAADIQNIDQEGEDNVSSSLNQLSNARPPKRTCRKLKTSAKEESDSEGEAAAANIMDDEEYVDPESGSCDTVSAAGASSSSSRSSGVARAAAVAKLKLQKECELQAAADEADRKQKELEEENAMAAQSGVLFPEETQKDMDVVDMRISMSCTPFLSWLCTPAMTEIEKVVKARRVDPKQLAPVKKNLAFIFRLLLGSKVVEPSQVGLDMFAQENVCQQLSKLLEERNSGASRIYALFLLVKKILVFLASSESAHRREFITPNTWNSWTCVDSVCSDSNTRRKQISQNRKLLGKEQSKRLEHLQGPMRVVPTAEETKMAPLFGDKKQKGAQAVPTSRIMPQVAAAAAAAAASNNSKSMSSILASTAVTSSAVSSADANEMSKDELLQLKDGCLQYLTAAQTNGSDADAQYVAYLVTATLCLGMAPRQQVLRQLQLGSSFFKKDDNRYWVLMLAQMNKNCKATTFPIAEELTKALDYYLSTVRPQLMGSKQHDYVFCKRTGDATGALFDFSDWTRTVGKVLIGRPINCHSFRSAVVTAIHEGGATQSEMNNIASCMGHDPATQRDYYYKVEAQKRAIDSHELVRKVFGMQSPNTLDSKSAGSAALSQVELQEKQKEPVAAAAAVESLHDMITDHEEADMARPEGVAAAAAQPDSEACAMSDNSTEQQ